MAAAATDLFKKGVKRWVGQIGAAGVSDASTTTVPLSSSTSLPTTTAVVVVIDRVDANGTATPTSEETVIGVVSGSNLVSCVRGAEGTAQSHAAGAVVEVLFAAKSWNDLIDGLLTEHNQLGGHTNITASNISASGTITNQTTNADLVLAGNGTGKVKATARYGALQADSIASASAVLDMSVSNQHTVTLASGVTTNIVASNVSTGQAFAVRLLQPASGSSGVASFVGGTYKWAGGSAPVLTTVNAKADWMVFVATGASAFDSFVIGANI